MTPDVIKAALTAHKLWAEGEPGGVRANLRGADLTGADLTRADLTGANLWRADLTDAQVDETVNAQLVGRIMMGEDLPVIWTVTEGENHHG